MLQALWLSFWVHPSPGTPETSLGHCPVSTYREDFRKTSFARISFLGCSALQLAKGTLGCLRVQCSFLEYSKGTAPAISSQHPRSRGPDSAVPSGSQQLSAALSLLHVCDHKLPPSPAVTFSSDAWSPFPSLSFQVSYPGGIWWGGSCWRSNSRDARFTVPPCPA